MKCQFCGNLESKVIDSRPTDDGKCIRRRRECLKCKARFTTYEKIEGATVFVIKKDQTREPFDIEKVKRGIIQACHKRPITAGQIDEIVDKVECFVFNSPIKEIKSTKIGEYVLSVLKDYDEVAYIRFASVYNRYSDAQSFMEELGKIIDQKDNI